jgi:hypothetical protein
VSAESAILLPVRNHCSGTTGVAQLPLVVLFPPFSVATDIGYPHTHVHTQLPAKVTPSPARAATRGVGGCGVMTVLVSLLR